MELFPSTEEYQVLEDDLYILQWFYEPRRTSVAGFLHHPSVLWSISQSSLSMTAMEHGSTTYGVGVGDTSQLALVHLGMPVCYFFLFLTLSFVFLKGFRQFL